jgi:plasmid replication initiation protein
MEFSIDSHQVIRKHNKIIESKYASLTEREKKLLALVISQIKNDDESFNTYAIPAHEIRKALDLDSDRIYEQLKEIALKLKKRTVLIEDLKDKSWEIFSYVDKALYKNGVLHIRLHSDLAPYLLNLYKDYTPLQLGIILSLKGTYTLTLYEWLKKWSNIGERTISVFEMREKLGVHDIKSYDNFAEFKRRILEPAIKDINEKSDLTFTYTTHKTAQKITELTFTIALKGKGKVEVKTYSKNTVSATVIEPESNHEPVKNELLFNLIQDLIPNLSRAKLIAIINENEMDKVLNAVAIVEKYRLKNKDIDLAGLFIESLKQGWVDAKVDKKQKNIKKEVIERENKAKEKESNAKRSAELLAYFHDLSSQQQQEMKNNFLVSQQENSLVLAKWKSAEKQNTDPLKQPMLKGLFLAFLGQLSGTL